MPSPAEGNKRRRRRPAGGLIENEEGNAAVPDLNFWFSNNNGQSGPFLELFVFAEANRWLNKQMNHNVFVIRSWVSITVFRKIKAIF